MKRRGEKAEKLNILVPGMKKQLLLVEALSVWITFLIPIVIGVVLAIVTRPIGFIIGAIGLCIPLFVFKPTSDRYSWSEYNMKDYLNRHSPAIDEDVLNSTDFSVLTTKSE